MKTSLSSRQRMLAAIHRREVDHIPLGQLFHSTVLDTPPDLQWTNQFQRAQIMKDLGLDPVIDIWLPAPEPSPETKVHKWKETDPDGPDPLLCAAYETAQGTLVQKVRQTADWYHFTHYNFVPTWDGDAYRPKNRFDEIDMMDDWSTRRYKVPLVRGPQDLDAFACLLTAPTGERRDQWIRNALDAKRIAQDLDLLTMARRVSIGDWFMWVCLIEDFCIAMVEDPEYAARFFDIIQSYNREILSMVLEAQPDVVQYRGWYDTPDYWGRRRYRDILLPRIQDLARQTHNGGSLFCYLLTEGYTLYRDFLPQIDADVFLGLEPLAARKSEDLALVKSALKDRGCIWGGINACVTVGRGTDAEIDLAVRTAIESLGPLGFILNAAIYIFDDDVSWDRFKVLINAWKRYSN